GRDGQGLRFTNPRKRIVSQPHRREVSAAEHLRRAARILECDSGTERRWEHRMRRVANEDHRGVRGLRRGGRALKRQESQSGGSAQRYRLPEPGREGLEQSAELSDGSGRASAEELGRREDVPEEVSARLDAQRGERGRLERLVHGQRNLY